MVLSTDPYTGRASLTTKKLERGSGDTLWKGAEVQGYAEEVAASWQA